MDAIKPNVEENAYDGPGSLTERGRAIEEEYFRRRDRQLIEKIRITGRTARVTFIGPMRLAANCRSNCSGVNSGISNVIIRPDLFDRQRTVAVRQPFLLVDDVLQHQDGVLSVRAGCCGRDRANLRCPRGKGGAGGGIDVA